MVGQKAVRRLKRMLDSTPRPYRCSDCGVSLAVEYHVCPECDGYRVELERESDGAEE